MLARLGSVRYLNAVPLLAGLDHDPEIELVPGTPAEIASGLEQGALDLGLVPVVEAARLGLFALPGAAVGASGPVRSVLLVSRVPLAAIRVLALDPASRTSAALARLLLQRVHGIQPELISGPADGNPVPAGADAGLVIGDRALAFAPDGLLVTDLAGWWTAETALPFVFALWAGRDETTVRRLGARLLRAKCEGLAHLATLAAQAARARGLACETATAYLRDSIRYDLGAPERAGLALFLDLVRKERLVAETALLRFCD